MPRKSLSKLELPNYPLTTEVSDIADNGIGIAQELRDKIFDAFVRGAQARRSDGGSGLGLTIAKHIVEKHRGRIRLDVLDGGRESTAGGHGTRFRIALPRK
ncbi:ATP-binding protein [Paenibacillus thiaminolyticus]|uniref:ATP-binding protein n=1 Tax=Paenibacillus thiaminolyticus TaxID=49283 RepID=UPI0030B98673